MVLDDRTDDDVVEPMRPNRRRRSAVHLGATFMRLLVVVGGLIVITSVWNATTGRALLSSQDFLLSLDALPQLQQAEPAGDQVIHLVDLPLWVRFLAFAPRTIIGVVAVWAALVTTKVLITIAAARPFEQSTARRVRTLGLVLSLGGTAAGLLDTTAMLVFSTTMAGDYDNGWSSVYSGLSFTADWPWALIITGVVVVAASAAFTEGARLQQESDGVV